MLLCCYIQFKQCMEWVAQCTHPVVMTTKTELNIYISNFILFITTSFDMILHQNADVKPKIQITEGARCPH